ncbi:NUDIX domain-containing protein [Flindersiella endophytica]
MSGLIEQGVCWREGTPPPTLDVVQVYGWLFDVHGRVLIQQSSTGFHLPGGCPRPDDRDAHATLVRQAEEESRADVKASAILGYEETEGSGGRPVALVWMVGRLGGLLPDRWAPGRPRPQARRFTDLPTAMRLLGWGEPRQLTGRSAGQAAMRIWGLPVLAPAAPDATV